MSNRVYATQDEDAPFWTSHYGEGTVNLVIPAEQRELRFTIAQAENMLSRLKLNCELARRNAEIKKRTR